LTDWQNKIIGHGDEPPDQLLANPGNWRIHPKAQQDALAGAIAEVGYIRSVTVNKRTGHVIDGHLRVALAMRQGVKSIPVEYVDLTEAEEAEALATLDPLAAMAAADKEKLDDLLQSVKSADAAVQAMLAEMAEKAGLYLDKDKPDDPGAQIDKAEELRQKWQTETGQLWELGEHRLICGDCTDRAAVERVMAGEKAEAVVTDPPHGQNRDGITNDDPNGLRELYDASLIAMPLKDAVVIAFQSPRLFPEWLDATRKAGHRFERALWFYDETDVTFPWRGWLMTSQIAIVSSMGKPKWADRAYHHDCYVVKTAGKQGFLRGGHEGSLGAPAEHPTMKPLDVVEDLVAHTMGIVYEPFLGSGTTLIACERLGRRGRGIEIEAKYVAVALERWSQMTGKEPRLIQ